jgi:hypothetical protein
VCGGGRWCRRAAAQCVGGGERVSSEERGARARRGRGSAELLQRQRRGTAAQGAKRGRELGAVAYGRWCCEQGTGASGQFRFGKEKETVRLTRGTRGQVK